MKYREDFEMKDIKEFEDKYGSDVAYIWAGKKILKEHLKTEDLE